jgi:hypothetical protein
MALTAKEIAEKFAGQQVKCYIIDSTPVFDLKTNAPSTQFSGRILGWKKAGSIDTKEYVLVETLDAQTKFSVKDFKKDCVWTFAGKNMSGYCKRLLPKEIELPVGGVSISGGAGSTKVIPPFPHKCRDCGSAAFIGLWEIDCSNKDCRHKFATKSGFDLFIPKNLREPVVEKKVVKLATPKKKSK